MCMPSYAFYCYIKSYIIYNHISIQQWLRNILEKSSQIKHLCVILKYSVVFTPTVMFPCLVLIYVKQKTVTYNDEHKQTTELPSYSWIKFVITQMSQSNKSYDGTTRYHIHHTYITHTSHVHHT